MTVPTLEEMAKLDGDRTSTRDLLSITNKKDDVWVSNREGLSDLDWLKACATFVPWAIETINALNNLLEACNQEPIKDFWNEDLLDTIRCRHAYNKDEPDWDPDFIKDHPLEKYNSNVLDAAQEGFSKALMAANEVVKKTK
jgi:hypothetical protein